MKLTEYEVDIDGLTHTLLLDEEDVKRYPGARKATGTRTGTPAPESTNPDTVEAILASVGSDTGLAQTALEAEQGKDKPRSTLIEKLQAVIAGGSTS